MSREEIQSEQDAKKAFKAANPKFHAFEKNVINGAVDHHATKLAHKFGLRRANWNPFLKLLIGICAIMNVMACYARPDFLTLVVCVLALLFLSDTDNINRDKFRLLPLMLLISIVYDFIWLFFIQDLKGDGQHEHGGLELSVKIFALRVTYIEFIFKFPFFLVLWKVSYNYLADIKEIKEAPRIIKLLKIIDQFKPEDDEDEEQRYQDN